MSEYVDRDKLRVAIREKVDEALENVTFGREAIVTARLVYLVVEDVIVSFPPANVKAEADIERIPDIEELDLSVRSYHCLRREGIRTVPQLVKYISSNRLSKIHNIGKKSEKEILRKVEIFTEKQEAAP